MKLRIFTEPQQGADYQTLRKVALAAEELEFDAFFRSDHYLSMGDGSGLPGPTDSWVTLAGLALETSRIRLGTLVTAATFRLPGSLAIMSCRCGALSACCPWSNTRSLYSELRAMASGSGSAGRGSRNPLRTGTTRCSAKCRC